ncbi:hypothetical protein [Chitinophaga filiformis]|uniref:Uncharacterized protein n=1 Tax=Chitinophaga filiformis TaxID=104663 RepID=A0A1G7LRC2_CHIFI|nr:hypothetical protein [Chitinophaga filiformis]SDF52057.1 hypothetical protein SAMN04488121_102161 [Chitinophaga filiformis]
MKPLLFSFAGITLLTLATIYHQQQKKESRAVSPQSGVQIIRTSCPDPCTGPMKWVKLNEAVEMISEYGKHQYKGIHENMVKDLQATKGPQANLFADSRYITFPLDTIKKFICKVESMLGREAHLNSVNQPIKSCDLGIKFYYAAYPGIAAEADIEHTKKGRHTLIMVPTYWDTALKNYVEFFPGFLQANKHPMTIEQVLDVYTNPQKTKQLLTLQKRMPVGMGPEMVSLESEKEVGKNQGNLCPPPDGCNAALLSLAKVKE